MEEVVIGSIIASLGTFSFGAGALFLARKWIVTRLTKSIQHEYDSKLAHIESELRRSEAKIGDVRNAAISNAMISQSALDKRRLQAIDDLWKGFLDAKKNIMAAEFMSKLNINEVSKGIKDPNIKRFVDTLTRSMSLDDIEKLFGEGSKVAQTARPWVGSNIWQIYIAYTSLAFYPVTVFNALKTGVEDPIKFINQDKIFDSVKKALPNLNLDWDNLSYMVIPQILELLETTLLQEIEFVVSGKTSDNETHRRAMEMAKRIEKLNQQENTADVQEASNQN